MTNHKTRTTDRGSAHAGSKDRPKRKPQAYIIRDQSGYVATNDAGEIVAWACRSADCDALVKLAGYTPVRNPHGDAPKTK